MRATRLVLIHLAVLAMPALAAAQEHRGVLYALPSNWRDTIQDDNKVFIPNGLRQGEAVVVLLMPSEAASAEPPVRQFETAVAVDNKELKVLGKGQVSETTRGTATLVVQSFDLEASDVGRHTRFYALVVERGRRARAIAVFRPDATRSRYEGVATTFLQSLRLKTEGSGPPVAGGPPVGTPTGETPELYPGMPGWLPSGRGVPIPAARLVDNKPQGLWWTTSYGSGTRAVTFVFLPDGIHASNPRYGGGTLVDIEGQKRQPGANGVGSFSISGKTITREYDGHRNTESYSTTADNWSEIFKIGAAVFRPITAPTKQTLAGTWTVAGTKYVFRPGDTYEMGQVVSGGGWAAGSRVTGAYSVDGHLVVLRPQGAPITITPIAFVGRDLILINGLLYRRS